MNISPTLENSAVKRIFAERKDFIIIGLTGRTGSGCTTVAKLLSKEFSALQPPKDFSGDLIESREDTIVYEYAETSWTPFRLIEMKHVIFTFILEENYDAFVSFVRDSVNLSVDLQKLETPFNLLHEKRIKLMGEVSALTSKGENVPDSDELYSFYFDEVPQFYEQFQASIPRAYYTKILQTIGDNIRASGSAYSREIKPDCILRLSQRVNMLI